jgi:hypothetical protein
LRDTVSAHSASSMSSGCPAFSKSTDLASQQSDPLLCSVVRFLPQLVYQSCLSPFLTNVMRFLGQLLLPLGFQSDPLPLEVL